MAATFKICSNDGTILYDFLDHANYSFTVKRGTLRSQPQEGLMIEDFVAVTRDADADIKTDEYYFDLIKERVNLYNSSILQKNPIWFYATADGETAKRSLITGIDIVPITQGDAHILLGGYGAYRRITITRLEGWERATVNTVNNWTALYTSAGMVDKSFTTLGDMANRIVYVMLRGEGVYGTSDPIYRAWIGIREYLEGSTDFDPLLQCESTGVSGGNSILATDASNVSDGTASNSYKARVSFSTVATMAKRLSIRLDNAGGSPDCDHFIGRYLILLRAKVTDGTTVASVKATGGFYGSSDDLFAPAGDPVYIDGSVSTSWLHYPLGELSIPPFPLYTGYYPAASGSMDKYTIQIHAERVVGSGSLDLDSIVLMPAERLCLLEGGAVQYSGGDLDPMYIYTTERGVFIAYAEVGGNPMNDISYNLSGSKAWEMPVSALGSPLMVVVFEEEDAHDITDGVEVRVLTVGKYRNRNIN